MRTGRHHIREAPTDGKTGCYWLRLMKTDSGFVSSAANNKVNGRYAALSKRGPFKISTLDTASPVIFIGQLNALFPPLELFREIKVLNDWLLLL